MVQLITSILGLVTAIISIVLVIVQRRSHSQEQNAFRQQLISLLHHAEGLRDSIGSVQMSALPNQGSANLPPNMSLYNTLDSVKQNASALFFGIMETKVGGKQLLDDLDAKYKKWSSLELDRKIALADNSIKVTKDFLRKQQNTTPTT